MLFGRRKSKGTNHLAVDSTALGISSNTNQSALSTTSKVVSGSVIAKSTPLVTNSSSSIISSGNGFIHSLNRFEYFFLFEFHNLMIDRTYDFLSDFRSSTDLLYCDVLMIIENTAKNTIILLFGIDSQKRINEFISYSRSKRFISSMPVRSSYDSSYYRLIKPYGSFRNTEWRKVYRQPLLRSVGSKPTVRSATNLNTVRIAPQLNTSFVQSAANRPASPSRLPVRPANHLPLKDIIKPIIRNL